MHRGRGGRGRGGRGGGPPFQQGPPQAKQQPAVQPGKLVVRDYPEGTDDAELRALFERFGKLQEVFSPPDRETGGTRGYTFVRYYNEEDAESAIKAMHGTEFKGAMLKVEQSLFAKGDGGPPRAGGRGGFPPRGGRGGPPPSMRGPPNRPPHGGDRGYYDRQPPHHQSRGYDYYGGESRRDPYYDYDYYYRRSPPPPRDSYYDRDPYYRSDDRYAPPHDRYGDRYRPPPPSDPYAQDRYATSDRYRSDSYDARSRLSRDNYGYDRRDYDAYDRSGESRSAGGYYSGSSQGNGYSMSSYGGSSQYGEARREGEREADRSEAYDSRRAPEGSVSYPASYSAEPSGSGYSQY